MTDEEKNKLELRKTVLNSTLAEAKENLSKNYDLQETAEFANMDFEQRLEVTENARKLNAYIEKATKELEQINESLDPDTISDDDIDNIVEGFSGSSNEQGEDIDDDFINSLVENLN